MAVYVYNPPEGEEAISFVYKALTNPERGVSRFFWSYTDKADLSFLMGKSWEEMDEEERDCWSHGKYLLRINPGDYIAHVNVPEYGKVTVGRVVSYYYFDKEMPFGDGNQCFDVEDVFTFDRNDERIHPRASSGLKHQGAHWCPSGQDELLEAFAIVRGEKKLDDDFSYTSKEMNEVFKSFAAKLQRLNPGKALEAFMAEVFRKVPGVTNVIENGSGWGTDNGADLIVSYRKGIPGYEEEEAIVVQVKSYEGAIYSTEAIRQINDALKKFDAVSGLIITTADSTPVVEEAVAKLSDELGKPVYLMAGQDTARFVLRYGIDLLS